jgi:3-isopropylmalate/(R)-2-methylmalate dehydratase small subunit
MQAISHVAGKAIPFGRKNVDTDVIIPAHWLKTVTRDGLAVKKEDGNVFTDERWAGAPILIAGDNFGCGSSREHAAWALLDMGVTCVIAPSFSDIFSGNAFKNGILTVALPQDAIDRLMEVAQDQPVDIDLDTQTVTTPFQDRFTFEIDAFRKHCLLNGLDEVGLTMAQGDAISTYETQAREGLPFLAKTLATT